MPRKALLSFAAGFGTGGAAVGGLLRKNRKATTPNANTAATTMPATRGVLDGRVDGCLPAGAVGGGNCTATVSGTPLANTAGVYHLTITAANSVANASQVFTLTVNQPPIVTSASSATFTRTAVNTFTFTAAGVPAAKFTLIGTLPLGLTFTANADGTATLKGKPTIAGHFVLTLSVTNGALPVAYQLFDLNVT